MSTTRIQIRRAYLLATLGYLLVCWGIFFAIVLFHPPWLPTELLIVAMLASLLFATILIRALVSCYQWIEVAGDKMRGKRLLKLWVREWEVGDILSVNGFGVETLGIKTPFVSAVDGSSRLGYEIGFRDGSKLMLSKHEMGSLDEFLIALADRIKQNSQHSDSPPSL